mmetsp:Transcript_924/g.3254  ORF Transcript_924/g.3254 Transcript_924/m.3254 type:complete len:135 (+) Transcript_924:639-1043(+)
MGSAPTRNSPRCSRGTRRWEGRTCSSTLGRGFSSTGIFRRVSPTRSSRSLLEHTNLRASEVDLLVIDAEGYDAEILDLFNGLPDFDPAIVIFEWAFHHKSRGKLPMVVKVANFLSDRGYMSYKDGDNLIVAKFS